jgi:1-acyl-sn-glycerol-3-phosphate acyltransferase
MQSLSVDHRTYRTGDTKGAGLFTSSRFYANFCLIFMRAAWAAKRGRYNLPVWWASSVSVVRALERVGVRFEVEGLHHVHGVTGPVLVVGNHLSVLETFVLPAFLLPYKIVSYVVKQSLMEYPLFRDIMRTSRPIAVSRTNPRRDLKQVMEQGHARLSDDISIIIFPQTTRAPFDPGQFSTIAVKLARKEQVPVVPMALLTDAWEHGRLLKDFGPIYPSRTVRFAFGEPLTVSTKGEDEQARIIDFIQDHLHRWQQERERLE